MRTSKRDNRSNQQIPQNGELYDVDDFRLALHELNKLGYELTSTHTHGNVHRLNVTCNKTKNRFVMECIGHKEWPETL